MQSDERESKWGRAKEVREHLSTLRRTGCAVGREHAHRHTRMIWFEMNAFHLVSLAVMNGSLGLFSVSTSSFHAIDCIARARISIRAHHVIRVNDAYITDSRLPIRMRQAGMQMGNLGNKSSEKGKEMKNTNR